MGYKVYYSATPFTAAALPVTFQRFDGAKTGGIYLTGLTNGVTYYVAVAAIAQARYFLTVTAMNAGSGVPGAANESNFEPEMIQYLGPVQESTLSNIATASPALPPGRAIFDGGGRRMLYRHGGVRLLFRTPGPAPARLPGPLSVDQYTRQGLCRLVLPLRPLRRRFHQCPSLVQAAGTAAAFAPDRRSRVSPACLLAGKMFRHGCGPASVRHSRPPQNSESLPPVHT